MLPHSIDTAHLLESYHWRYAVKRFDSSRRIDATTWEALEKSLVLTPSSFGLQPWKFFVINSPEIKDQLPTISWNQSQPRDCSHLVVMVARKTLDEAYVDKFLHKVATDRGIALASLDGYKQAMLGFLKNTEGKHLAWSSNQCYIALGQLMASAAVLGIDACPMEGIVASEYDNVLGLVGSEYTTVVCCALGYRHADDKYAHAIKVRFHATDVVHHL